MFYKKIKKLPLAIISKSLKLLNKFNCFAVCLLIAAPPVLDAQTCKGSILKDRLLLAVRANLISKKALVSNIKLCGVDFKMTAQDESELTAVGAPSELIEAARNNYRAAAAGKNKPSAAAGKYDESFMQSVVLFSQTPHDPDLVAAHLQKVKNALRQTIALDPDRSEAYAILGLIMFLTQENAEAEANARAAVERGGAALFPVLYARDASRGDIVEGIFFVGKGAIAFQSTDGQENLQGDNSGFIRVRQNNEKNSKTPNAFSIDYQIEGELDVFTFAPNGGNAGGAALIVKMINENLKAQNVGTLREMNVLKNLPSAFDGAAVNNFDIKSAIASAR